MEIYVCQDCLCISFSIPIKNRNNVCQDCLFHLAYLLEIEIYTKIVYFFHLACLLKIDFF